MRVEVSLFADLGHITQCGKVVRNCFCPAAGQLLEEPVLIQPLNVICCVFQLIFQKHIAVLESASEGIVEVPIEAIHLIRLLRIELPDCFRFYDMEACCILLIKVLHLCNIVETVIIVLEPLNPSGSAAVFRSFQHQLGLYHMICNFGEEAAQDDLMNGRENVCCQQRFNILLFKSGSKMQLLLHTAAQFPERTVVLVVAPFVDNTVTIRLVGIRDETLQAFENAGIHRLRKGGQQHMGSEQDKRFFILMDVARVLADKLPESVNVAELFDIAEDGIVFLTLSCRKDSNKYILRRAAV